MNTGEHLTRAEGFADLGMYERAWSELEELPPEARTDPRVLDLRLRIATAVERWSLAECRLCSSRMIARTTRQGHGIACQPL
jgi:hypothetical protein